MINPDFSRELALISQGFSCIGGLDEVGRGCWAGPVVAAIVIFSNEQVNHPPDWTGKIRDSKTLSKTQRESLNQLICEQSLWGIGESTSQEIDRIGIGKATTLAMEQAINRLTDQPNYLLIDGRERVTSNIEQQSIIDGDALCTSIAAASIIAKVYRDRLMAEYDELYPGYHFSSHVGYGTKAHQESLANLGPCAIHRFSYKPVQRFSSKQ